MQYSFTESLTFFIFSICVQLPISPFYFLHKKEHRPDDNIVSKETFRQLKEIDQLKRTAAQKAASDDNPSGSDRDLKNNSVVDGHGSGEEDGDDDITDSAKRQTNGDASKPGDIEVDADASE